MKRAACIAVCAAMAWSSTAHAARVTVLDDGEKVARDAMHPLPESVWPSAIELFALRDETVAFQVVVEPDGEVLEHVRTTLEPFSPALAGVRVDLFEERFVEIQRASYNERSPGSLAFTPEAAPAAGAYVGFFADALVPGDETHAGPTARGAVWVDIHVPPGAPPGVYTSVLRVRAGDRTLAERSVSLRVADAVLPYPGPAAITTFYDSTTLKKRMGDRRAERSLRQTLHAHRLSAIHDVTTADALAGLDEEALSGKMYTEAAGYAGPGVGVGEGILAIGAYGMLGEPDAAKAAEVGRIAARVRSMAEATEVFVYAVDENCKSSRGVRWMDLLRAVPEARGVRVGVTCSEDPRDQAADLVMMLAERYDPKVAEKARARGKRVWVYNGQRPFAGPMMLDVPATDLRANAWIAARYGVVHWFYWESTFWLDSNRGGRGGERGFDPFVVSETFHNADGDHANGDGILVYPGTQAAPGMRDDGKPIVYPSVRLKNLRRGAEDAGYIQLARAVDAVTTDAIVGDVVARGLAEAKAKPAWPERGSAWLAARKELLEVIERKHPPRKPRTERVARWFGCTKCGMAGAPDSFSFGSFVVGVAWVTLAIARRAGSRRDAATRD
ncbi:DUF4091 domain-containing protein [Pendulispora brunnea]|uniref:DUF4091 domain-containing protein n=1 Tax=Pendulispora brunnea TaxID=2905690 RepID=A0ABZ2K022_9BACT